jgi:hypothetical protein
MSSEHRMLRLNVQGADVSNLHDQLIRRGYSIDAAERAMSIFGATTRRHVMDLQDQLGLQVTGAVDKETAEAFELSGGRPLPPGTVGPEIAVGIRDNAWFKRLSRRIRLEAGAPTPDLLRVPAADAQRILRETVRLVADTPPLSSPDVVWVLGASELIVHTSGMGLSCLTGQVTVSVPVACDQVPDAAQVEVPFAVGTEEAPSGLVMSTLARPAGPAVVVDAWAGSLVAFAWEALLHLAQQLCAEVGQDGAGQPLVPAYIGGARGVLLVQPMARHPTVGPR